VVSSSGRVEVGFGYTSEEESKELLLEKEIVLSTITFEGTVDS
jgi:hypothetical protein